MPPVLPLPRQQTCTACLRCSTRSLLAPSPLAQHQTRGKKRSTRGPDTIPVRLRKDVPGFGRTGSVVPLSAGQMRNHFARMGLASYMSPDEKRALKKKGGPTVQRDVLFLAEAVGKTGRSRKIAIGEARARERGEVSTEQAEEPVEEEEVESVRVQRVEPQRSLELIGVLLPGKLEFSRQRQAEDRPDIFGSVSAVDVVEAVREALAHNDEASRVVLSEGDISFIDTRRESGPMERVKELGQYQLEIRVKGADGVVMRPVNIIAQQEEVKLEAN